MRAQGNTVYTLAAHARRGNPRHTGNASLVPSAFFAGEPGTISNRSSTGAVEALIHIRTDLERL